MPEPTATPQSAEIEALIDTLRRAADEMDDEWSENRAMGQDRTEWGTWRAVIGWLRNVADRAPHSEHPTPEKSHAINVASTYLGLTDPRTRPGRTTTNEGDQ